MIKAGISLQKKAEVYNIEEVRDWRRFWLTKRIKRTKVFTGYINHYYRDGWTGDILEIVDETHRTRQKYHMEEKANFNFGLVGESLEANPGVKRESIAT